MVRWLSRQGSSAAEYRRILRLFPQLPRRFETTAVTGKPINTRGGFDTARELRNEP